MGSDDPEEVQFRQPFMSRGKDGDGEYLYFKGRDGARQEVARVEESGVGRQEAGKYRQTMSDKQMSGHGVNAPPLHGHCFCLLIPAGLDAMADMGRPAPRTPHQAPADTWPHPHLPPHGHVEAIPYQPAPPPEPEPVKTPAKKPTPSLNFDDLARKVPLTEVKPLTSLGQENVNPVFTARLGKTAVYVKPGHIHFDPADAVARHRAVADTARALGAEQMVMPAALVRSEEALREAGRVVPELLDRKNFVTPSMFVTQAAPAGAVPAYAQAPQALAKVREADRLSGALVDFLHANGDRHDGNVLVDDRGHLFLIDHDLTASTDATSSVFFPGGGLSYAQRQRSLSDLPAALRAHVSEVAETDVDALSQTYSLSEEAAAAMKKRAQDVVRKGLDAALSEHGAWWQSVGPDALERSGEVVPR